MTSFKFQTPCAPVFVPIDKNNNIAYDIIPNYSKYLTENGITSIFVNGGCGEFSSLTIKERKLVLEKWVTESGSGTQIVVNVGTSNYADTVDLANHALQFKIDGIVLIPPFYMPVANESDLIEYLASIVRTLSRQVPVLYYHIPMLTKVNINLGDFVSLLHLKKLNCLSAIKYTDPSAEDLAGLMHSLRVHDSSITVFCGYEPLLKEAIDVGVTGCVLAFVNIIPTKIRAIFDAALSESRDEDMALVKNIFNSIVNFAVSHRVQVMGLLKIAAELRSGLCLGPMRPPYVINDDNVASFCVLLSEIGLLNV